MCLHCFTVRALAPEADPHAINAFCANHRALVVDGPGPFPSGLKRPVHGARPVVDGATGSVDAALPDCRQLLSEADFAVFVALRTWRKAQSQTDGVPPYAVFTNEQLAAMARQRCSTLAELGTLDGVSPARLDRYGAAALGIVAQAAPAPVPAAAPAARGSAA
jgi:superfamily II DNA helicase RecQ